jgi:hypothetical protein
MVEATGIYSLTGIPGSRLFGSPFFDASVAERLLFSPSEKTGSRLSLWLDIAHIFDNRVFIHFNVYFIIDLKDH